MSLFHGLLGCPTLRGFGDSSVGRRGHLLGSGGATEEPGLPLLLEAVALAFDVQGGGMVQQPVEDGRRQDLVVEDLTPVDEALVGGEDEAGLLVAPAEETEEETRLLPGHGEGAHLVEDEDPGGHELLQLPFEPVLHPGPGQASQERLQRQEEDPMARFRGFHPQGDRQVGLAHPGRPEQDDVLGPLDETEAGQLAHDLAVQTGLEGEVKLVEGLDPGEACEGQPGLDALEMAPRPLGREGLGEELLVGKIPFGRLLADGLQLGGEMPHLHLLEEAYELHWSTSS